MKEVVILEVVAEFEDGKDVPARYEFRANHDIGPETAVFYLEAAKFSVLRDAFRYLEPPETEQAPRALREDGAGEQLSTTPAP